MGYLRKKIADYYKKPKNCIILNIGGIRYDLEDDHILISGLKVDMVIAEITNRHQ